jgi:SAM-dependent methyltransferase
VRYLAADCGIQQFLDIGTGLPAPDNTHEVAQQVAPSCRVVYCDSDPLVLAHARALLVGSPSGVCAYIDADVRDADMILGEAAQTLDLTQPVAMLLLAILHFLPDSDDPAKVVATLADGLAPGSFVAISHLTADLAPEQVRAAAQAYNAVLRLRSRPAPRSGDRPFRRPAAGPTGSSEGHRMADRPRRLSRPAG